MARRLSVLLIAAAILGLTTFGLPAAVAAPTASTDVTAAGWRVPRPTPSPTATPSPTHPSPAPSSPAPTAACAFPTTSFNGAAYCPATIATVQGTMYGIGTRVVLKGVTVTTVVAKHAQYRHGRGMGPSALLAGTLLRTDADPSEPDRDVERHEPPRARRRARPVRFHHHGLHHPSRLHQDRLLPDRLVLTTLWGPARAGCPASASGCGATDVGGVRRCRPKEHRHRCREHHAAAAPRLSGRGPSGPESGGSIARQSPSEPFQPDKGVSEVDEQGKADRGSHEVFDHEPILALRMGLADGTDTFLTHLDDSLTPARLRPCARGTRLVP